MSSVAVPRRGSSVPLRRRVMPSSLLSRELIVTLARPRALVIKTLVPLVLTLPLLLGHAPAFWAAMLFTVLVAIIGAVGTAVTIARARESGLLVRLALTPRPASLAVIAWMAGAVIIDFLQLVPTLIALFVLEPVSAADAGALLAIVVATLVAANTVGCAISLLGGGPGEVLVDLAVVLGPLLFLAGLFSGVPREGWRWIAARVDPFAYAHSAFLTAFGVDPTFGLRSIVVAAAATVIGCGVVLALLARPVLQRR
ncbi:MAG TPA: ABC transporter permease [Candidatus Dormibacteraeota bacterium]|nr:ABC transporter permease [Candidatus Dormibacteraeota bacterium]